MRIAVIDDYQAVAHEMADWSCLPGCEVDFFCSPMRTAEELVERLAPYEGLVVMRERTKFPADILRQLSALKLLVTTGMNNRSIDLAAARVQGIVICGTPWAEDTTVELTWGLILSIARWIPQEDASLRGGRWQSRLGVSLRGKTLGIVGLGTIGTKVAQIGKLFGMRVIAWSPNLTATRASAAGVELSTKDDLLSSSDVLSMHLILSDTTRGIIGAAELAKMKPTALVINTARGPLIDEYALGEALREGHVAGAAVDVFDAEPIEATHPLLNAPHTILTPHIGYVTREVYSAWYAAVVEDIAAYLAGAPLRHLNP
jgi:phosphoglycerate dehydrogenase-like enzyme